MCSMWVKDLQFQTMFMLLQKRKKDNRVEIKLRTSLFVHSVNEDFGQTCPNYKLHIKLPLQV